jgi:hypothetical protein
MADGLGMTPEEWSDLRAQVDDSFWVMRAIGVSFVNGGHYIMTHPVVVRVSAPSK